MLVLTTHSLHLPPQGQIQDSPWGDGGDSGVEMPTYKFARFSQKLHEIFGFVGRGHTLGAPLLDPPLLLSLMCSKVENDYCIAHYNSQYCNTPL